MIFLFKTNAAKIFDGLLIGLGLLLLLVQIVAAFLSPDNEYLPKTLASIKSELIVIIPALVGNILAIVDLTADSDVLKVLEILFLAITVSTLIYCVINISKPQFKRTPQQNNTNRNEQYSVSNIFENDGRDRPTDCTICITTIRSIDRLIKLGCGHKFHDSCFQGWSQRRCPNCNCPY